MSLVAYQLKLLPNSLIFPIFHITLLKQFQEDQPEEIFNPLQPMICLSKVVAYWKIKHRKECKQVLVKLDLNAVVHKLKDDLGQIAKNTPMKTRWTRQSPTR